MSQFDLVTIFFSLLEATNMDDRTQMGDENADLVKLNVGGNFYMTSVATLTREPNSFFSGLRERENTNSYNILSFAIVLTIHYSIVNQSSIYRFVWFRRA